MKIKAIFHNVALFALALVIAGCREEDQYQLRFSHYLHVTENEMSCDECHGEPGQPDFNMITHETCLDCHDEPEAEEISIDTCGICHQKKQIAIYEAASILAEDSHTEASVTADQELIQLMAGAEEEPAVVAEEPTMGNEAEPVEVAKTETVEVAEEQAVAPPKSVFVHTEALSGKCMDCHNYIMDEELETVPVLSRSDILSIREDAHGSGQACLTCHVDMDRAQEPASHDVAWLKRHGQFGMQDEASCSVCHTEDSCRECHSVMQPINHNTLFRTRTHGVLAAWDRASCQVCHEEDSCTSCHAQTPPRSHRGRWAASGKYPTHCISCHTDATAGEGCVVCHEEGNNVLLHEKYWTPVHDLLGDTANCYQCHKFGKF